MRALACWRNPWRHKQASALTKSPPRCRGGLPKKSLIPDSNVEIGHAQGIVLDELAARFDDVAHELHEQVVRIRHVLDLYLQKRAHVTVESRFPELLRGHFAKAFIALQLETLAARCQHGGEQRQWPVDLHLVALSHQGGGL